MGQHFFEAPASPNFIHPQKPHCYIHMYIPTKRSPSVNRSCADLSHHDLPHHRDTITATRPRVTAQVFHSSSSSLILSAFTKPRQPVLTAPSIARSMGQPGRQETKPRQTNGQAHYPQSPVPKPATCFPPYRMTAAIDETRMDRQKPLRDRPR